MMAGADEERSREPTFRSIAAIVAILSAVLVAAAIAYRKPIAESLLAHQLQNLGIAATFEVRRFGVDSFELGELRVGDREGLEIARIEARYSPRGLFASRLDELRISGVRLRGTFDAKGVSFGPLDRVFEQSDASEGSSGFAALPAAVIAIEDAKLELATAEGPLFANLTLETTEIETGRLAAEAKLEVDHALANLDAHLSATGSLSSLVGELELEARAAGDFGTDASVRAASLSASAAFSFEAGDIAIQPHGCAEIRIEGLALKSLLTVSSPLDLCLRSRSEAGIRIANEGRVELDFEVTSTDFAADLRIGDASQRVSGKLPTLQIRTTRRGDEFETWLETEGGRLALAGPALEARGIRIEASTGGGSDIPVGHLQIEQISDLQPAARFPKLALDARFAPVDDGVDFAMEFANSDRNLVLEIKGVHRLAESAGRADVHLHSIDFDPGHLQPSTLFPILSKLLTAVSGSIELKGSAEWDADGIRGTAEVAITDAGATSKLATVEHLNAIVELNETGATSLDQTVSIGRLDFGLELTDGLIRYRVKPGGAVAIESAAWKFAGGELTTDGEIDLQSEKLETSLHVEGVDLARLIELVNLEGISGSGTLEGDLPIALVGDEVEIKNAVLRSSGGSGVIRYRPNPAASSIVAADQQFGTALTILEDFHYERLEIEINGSATGDVVIQIHLAGVNPDYQDGHPVAFNLSVDARLSDLLRTGMRIYRMPEKIEERLRAFAEKKL